MKYRSKCKVCGACPHGRQRSVCKECGGASICEHGRQRSKCKEGGGSQICEHGRERFQCKSAVGLRSASTVVYALMQGVRWCINLRARPSALLLQGVRRVCNLRAWSSALSLQGLSRRTAVIKHPLTTIIFTTRTCREAWKEKNFLELVRSLINDNRGDALRAASSLTSNSIHHRTHLSVRRVSPNNP